MNRTPNRIAATAIAVASLSACAHVSASTTATAYARRAEYALAGTDGVHGIAIAPGLHRGFITDGREIATIAFDGNPELAADDGAGHVFVNIEDKAQLVRIDAAGAKVTDTWALDDCDGPQAASGCSRCGDAASATQRLTAH